MEKVVTESAIPPYRYHLQSSEDLITTREAKRAGFVALALEKSHRATYFVAQARALRSAALQANSPADLLTMTEIQPALLAAAGLSDKSLTHLQPEDLTEALTKLIEKFLVPAGDNFVEELISRFLLTRGDSLGGSLRNFGGVYAQRKLTSAIITAFDTGGIRYRWQDARTHLWTQATLHKTEDAASVRALSWQSKGVPRTLVYSLTVPIVRTNVDMCLFDVLPQDLEAGHPGNPEPYVALGELKGGIDPAGADEHWKTASTALSRIRDAFSKQGFSPYTFFVGAAIEKRMAAEIWNQLQSESLANAANLNSELQVSSLARWLISL